MQTFSDIIDLFGGTIIIDDNLRNWKIGIVDVWL